MTVPRHALVIGGTGFISQYAVEELASAGYIVSIITRGATADLHGDLVASRIKVNCNRRKVFIETLQESLNTISQDQHLDSVPSSWDLVVDFVCFEPDHAEDVVEGLAGRCKLFIQISTDSIYEVCKHPPSDKYDPILGRNEDFIELLDLSHEQLMKLDDYGYNKYLCEKVFRDNISRLPFVALRLPDVLGEREWPRSRHNQYQARVQLGLPIYVNAKKHLKPQEKRISFVYAGDVARAIVACGTAVVTNDTKLDQIIGHGFNIGSVQSITLRQYVHFIGQVLGVPAFPFSTPKERQATFQAAREYRKSKYVSLFSKQANTNNNGEEQETVYFNAACNATSYSLISRLVLKRIGVVASPKSLFLPQLIQVIRHRFPNQEGFYINSTFTEDEKKYRKDISEQFSLPNPDIIDIFTMEESRSQENDMKEDIEQATEATQNMVNIVRWSDTDNPKNFVKLLESRDVVLSSSSSSSSSNTSSSSDDIPADPSDPSDLGSDENNSTITKEAKILKFVETQLHKDEHREEDDMYSYLPSVNEGHVNTTRAECTLPNYKNSDVWVFLRRMIIWYSYQDIMSYMDTDAITLARRFVFKTTLKLLSKRNQNHLE